MSFHNIEQLAHRKNLRALLKLRSLAFCAQIITVFITFYGLNIVLPVVAMVICASFLALFNVYSFLRLRLDKPVGNADIFIGLVVDVLVLSLQLYFSGGIYNPFVSFFMLPVIIAAVVLDKLYAWIVYSLTIVCYIALAIVAFLYPPANGMNMHALEISEKPISGLIDRSYLHMNGMMLGYIMCAGVLVFLIVQIKSNLAQRDAEIEIMKARAVEESHFVRMGLLSASAAHELGSPLTTLSVILKDLIELPLARKKSALLTEFLTMQAQVKRCKLIVTDILTASGEIGAQNAKLMLLDAFFAEITSDWRALHPHIAMDIRFELAPIPVVADSVIRQVVHNVLDNAKEAIGDKVKATLCLWGSIEADNLLIFIGDEGAGFTPDILSRLGQPYLSTKTAASDGRGRGMGLFLVMRALSKLGGELSANNVLNADGSVKGACVHIRLPLGAIKVKSDDDA